VKQAFWPVRLRNALIATPSAPILQQPGYSAGDSMQMRSRLTLLLPLALALGCADSTAPDAMPAELIGTWRAEQRCAPQCRLVLHSVVHPADSINVTPFFATVVTIGSRGSFLFETFPSPPDAPKVSGTARVSGSQIIVRAADGTEDRLDFAVNGDLLTLQFNGVFDFNGDGLKEPAQMRGVFRADPR
jgi:hypothetical protein